MFAELESMATSKIVYVTRQLKTVDGKTPRFSSLPLVIPNDTEYNSHTNELMRIRGELHVTLLSFSIYLCFACRSQKR